MVDMILNLLGLIFSILILAKAAGALVKNLTSIAALKNWSEFSVSVFLAVATTAPELTVGITAARDGHPNLSLGNVIGSNIINLTLIAGLVALVARGVKISARESHKDAPYAAAIAITPLLLMIDGSLSRFDGFVLLAFFAAYIHRVYHLRGQGKHSLETPPRPMGDYVVLTLFWLFWLLLSSRLLVSTAEATAGSLGMPLVLIGLFVVAFGTSLPELLFGLKAALKHKTEMALGDVIGATIFNAGLVLGLTAIISPIKIEAPAIIVSSSIFLILALFAFTIFVRSDSKISRGEGLVLLLIFATFAVVEFALKAV